MTASRERQPLLAMQAIVAANAVAFSRTLARSPSLATAVLDWTMAVKVIKQLQEEDNGEIENLTRIEQFVALCAAGKALHPTREKTRRE